MLTFSQNDEVQRAFMSNLLMLECMFSFPQRSYDLRQLPPVDDVKMNLSQYAAFILAINKKLCLIQGPPGTGKTYVGLRIVETLLHNQISEKPILVVCYTNHALDQFLEGAAS